MLGDVVNNFITIAVLLGFGYWVYSSIKDKDMKDKITNFFKGDGNG